MKRIRLFTALAFVLALIFIVSGAQIARSATLVVTSTADSGPGTLRDAIQKAQPGDTITFDPSVTGVITLTSGSLELGSTSLSIKGPGANVLAIDGNNAVPVFTIVRGQGPIAISGLTIQHGLSAKVPTGGAQGGGGIVNHNNTLTVSDCTITGNSIINSGGSGGGILNAGGTLTVDKCVFSDNSAAIASAGRGGGLENTSEGTVVVSNSIFSGNAADWGGGGLSNSFGKMTISNSTFSGNTSKLGGGGIGNHGFNTPDVDAGIQKGELTISGSTFVGNKTAGKGGAIMNEGGTLLLINSTLSENSAEGDGGGLDNEGGKVTISNSTLAGNTAGGEGGGLINYQARINLVDFRLGSSIVAGNKAPSGPDIRGAIVSLGNNLVGNSGQASGFIISDQLDIDSNLEALADNGGPTQTMALNTTSSAIGKGNCALGDPARPVSTDQRGMPRKTPCDVGAHESSFTSAVSSPTPTKMPPTPTAAAGIVNNTNDSGPGSLRDTIGSAASGTTITFDPAVFNKPQTITLTSGGLTITTNLTIQGPASGLAIDGNNKFTVFTIGTGATVALSSLTIQHGSDQGHCCGAGIVNNGTLTIRNSTISGNKARAGGGINNMDNATLTVINSTITGNEADYGGGIVSSGTLTVSNSTIAGNTAAGGGGGIDNDKATLNLGSSIVAGNKAWDGPDVGADIKGVVNSLGNNLIGLPNGATGYIGSDQQNVDPKLNALGNNGGSTPTMSLKADSPAIGKGNCALGSPAEPVTTDQRGTARKSPCDVGAVESNVTTGSGTTAGATQTPAPAAASVVRNVQDKGPGSLRDILEAAPENATITFDPAVFVKPQTIKLTGQVLTIARNVTIQGPGAKLLAVDGNLAVRVFVVNKGVTATLSQLTIQRASKDAAVHNMGTLIIDNATFTANTMGAIHNEGTLTVIRSQIVNNSSGWSGAGLRNSGTATISDTTLSGNSASEDGAIDNSGFNGELTLNNCTISDNWANANGGAIRNDSTMTINNSTITGNTAGKKMAGAGGGLINYSSATLTINNSTIAGNVANGPGGGINNMGGVLNLGSSIVAGNKASGSGPDINGDIGTLGYNLIGNPDGATGFLDSDQQKVDPKLKSLADNGGPTQTMALQTDSPAIGKGYCLPDTTDQRGAPRKSPCDVGAYESGSTPKVP